MTESNGAPYVLNEEHQVEAVSHLIELFRGGVRNQAVLFAATEQVQELENELWKLRSALYIDTAVDGQLDLLGKILKEDRKGRSDSAYRAILRVRILENITDGFPVQIEEIAEALLPGELELYQEFFPKTIYFEFTDLNALTLQEVYYELKRSVRGGTKLVVSYGEAATVGAVDSSPAGGIVGAVDGSPAGFLWSAGA